MASAETGGSGSFAAELKAQRAARGWTRVELGKHIGYSGSFISDAERGDRSPSDDFAQRRDEAFGLPGTCARLHEDLRRKATTERAFRLPGRTACRLSDVEVARTQCCSPPQSRDHQQAAPPHEAPRVT
jgi:transcriptional regulator with XRE-family HTH domain